MSQNETPLGEKVINNAATFGKITAVFDAVIGTIFGLVFVIISIYYMLDRKKMNHVIGDVIENSECNTTDNKKPATCKTFVNYIANRKEYKLTIDTVTSEYKKGDKIKVWYYTNNPEITRHNVFPMWVYYTMLVFGLLIISGSWFWVWLTRKYKSVAVVTGVAGVIDIL